MVRVVGDAKNGVSASAQALDQLGLSADQLAAAGPEQALLDIADAIKAQPDATSKASAAYAVFGRQGQELLTFLNQGSEGLRANAAEAERLGLAYSRVDAAQIEAANDSITRVKALAKGAGQTLTVQLAPFIDAAAKKLLEMATAGGNMGDKVVTAVEWVAFGIAKVADGLGFFKAAFHGAQAVATGQLALVVTAIAKVGKAIETLLNLIPGVEVSFGELADVLAGELTAAAEEAAKKSQAAFDSAFNGENAAAVAETFQSIRDHAREAAEAIHNQNDAVAQGAVDFQAMEEAAKNAQKVTDSLAGLDQQLERFGLNDIELKLADLAELGATNDQLEKARATLEKIKALEASNERGNKITDTLEDLESQVRTFGLSQSEKTLLDLEALGATEDQLERAAAAMDRLKQLQAGTASGTAGNLIAAGSAESQRLAFQAARGNQSRSDDTPKRQLNVQQRMASLLGKIESNQRSGNSAQEFDI